MVRVTAKDEADARKKFEVDARAAARVIARAAKGEDDLAKTFWRHRERMYELSRYLGDEATRDRAIDRISRLNGEFNDARERGAAIRRDVRATEIVRLDREARAGRYDRDRREGR